MESRAGGVEDGAENVASSEGVFGVAPFVLVDVGEPRVLQGGVGFLQLDLASREHHGPALVKITVDRELLGISADRIDGVHHGGAECSGFLDAVFGNQCTGTRGEE